MILKRYFNFQKELLCLKEQRKCTTKMKHTLLKLIRNGIMVNDLLIIEYKKQTGFFFKKIGFHSMQGLTATTRHGVTRK